MNPHETQTILDYINATWPRNPMSADTADAWATALVTIDYDTALKAVKTHSLSERGHFPPDIADIGAAMRAKQREQRPANEAIATIQADAALAARDRDHRRQRISNAQRKVGQLRWLQLIDQAHDQLCAEYGHTYVPSTMVANRACEIVETQP